MALKFFSILAHHARDGEKEINNFLASHRVLSVDRRFIDRGENSRWAFCVDYQSSAGGPRAGPWKSRID